VNAAELRQAAILKLARATTDGLTAYSYTRGFPKYDAMQFWNDAKALGLVRNGNTPRGTARYKLPDDVSAVPDLVPGEYPCAACTVRKNVDGAHLCPRHSTDVWKNAR
jgi:hypothetical protein